MLTKRVKGNNQKWFDGEVLEKLNSRDKHFQKLQIPHFRLDQTFHKELFKKAKYLNMPNKSLISNVIKDNDSLTYDTQ